MKHHLNNTLQKYSDIFVETGIFKGEGVEIALSLGFDQVYSIELLDFYYNNAIEKFKNNPKVHIIKGDSAFILYDVIKPIKSKITFWLDGHFMKRDPQQASNQNQFKKISPIMEELAQIKQHDQNDHIILIDDIHEYFTESGALYMSEYATNINSISNAIKNINSKYNIDFIGDSADVLRAMIQCN